MPDAPTVIGLGELLWDVFPDSRRPGGAPANVAFQATQLGALRNHGLTVYRLSTNALMLDRHMDTIFEYRDVIRMFRPSVDAASKDVYERIRIGGDWETLHRNLAAFAERNARERNGFPVSVDNVVSRDNYHEIGFIPSMFSYLAEPQNFGFNPINSLAPDQNEYFLKASVFDEHLTQHPCHMPWEYLGVLKDGRFTACHRDYEGELAFGSATDDDPEVAYNGSFMKELRRAHLDDYGGTLPEMCRKCMIVDPRLGHVLNAMIHYFYLNVRRHPVHLQNALNRIGPLLNEKKYDDVMRVMSDL